MEAPCHPVVCHLQARDCLSGLRYQPTNEAVLRSPAKLRQMALPGLGGVEVPWRVDEHDLARSPDDESHSVVEPLAWVAR
jgi:hypothetical protein